MRSRALRGFDTDANVLTAANSADVISRAHAAGTEVLVSVGGANTAAAFRGATSGGNRAAFVANIVALMTSRGYDGVDIDWEPLGESDGAQYDAFIRALRAALDALSPRPLLTAAVLGPPALLASLQDQFDQINFLNYDLSGAYPGWVTWHNSPVFDGGCRFVSTGALVPSTDGMVSDFIAAGVAPLKLGIGLDFYGYVWSGGTGTPTGGVTEPCQSWTNPPSSRTTPRTTRSCRPTISPRSPAGMPVPKRRISASTTPARAQTRSSPTTTR